MQIDTVSRAPWTVLVLNGKLDNAGSDQLRAVLLPLLAAGGSVAMDFSRVDYVTSAGFRVLLQGEKEQRQRGGRLLIAGLSPALQNFFEIAGLHTVIRLAPDLEAGIAAES